MRISTRGRSRRPVAGGGGLPRLLVAVAAMALAVARPDAAAPATEAAAGGYGAIREIGTLKAGFTFNGPTPGRPGLLVDAGLHRGFLLKSSSVVVYDLRALRRLVEVPLPSDFNLSGKAGTAFDPVGHRIFVLNNPSINVTEPCKAHLVWEFDTRTLEFTRHYQPCISEPVPDGFVAHGISFDERSRRLYLVGTLLNSNFLTNITGAAEGRQPTIIRQIDPETFESDWDADVSASCEWHAPHGSEPATVARAGDVVLTYCLHGGRHSMGGRGVTLAVPLVGGRPVRSPDGTVATILTPTFTDLSVIPEVDPVTGRVVVVAANRPFGPAAWVVDPVRRGFVGVVPTGLDPNKSTAFDYAFDPMRGRLFLHSARGFAVVDARATPLPGGVTYEVAAYPQDARRARVVMGVDPILRRLFLPNEKADGWTVFEESVPDPPRVEPPNPDAGTADIPEQPGVTDRSYAAGATAMGVHVLLTGGVPTVVHGTDFRFNCYYRYLRPDAPCIAETLASPGNREYFLAQSTLSQGSTSGASAFASAGRVSPRDNATDADVRSTGRCYTDRAERVQGSPPPLLAEHCPQSTPGAHLARGTPLQSFTFENLREGTAPKPDPARDFPIPASFCADGGEAPEASDPRGTSLGAGASDVSCDANRIRTSAEASATSVNLSGLAPGAGLLIGHTSSSVTSRFVPGKGLVTTAKATVEGVRVLSDPPMSIGLLATEATTQAFGRTGTTKVQVARTIAGVRSKDYTCDRDCDPERVIQALNAAFGTMVSARWRPPYQFASPRGYTAVVAKDPFYAASDAALNENDTVTFNALDIVFINDFDRGAGADGQSNTGRSRLTIGLAGVQAESHYGVFLLARGATDTATDGIAGDVGLGGALGDMAGVGLSRAPGEYSIAPPAAASTVASVRSPGVSRFPRTLAEAIRLVVNNPAQAALLAVLLALLAAPVYLSVRRRAVALLLDEPT